MQKINIPQIKDIQLFRNASSIDECEQLKIYRDVAQNKYTQLPNPTYKDDEWRFIKMPEIAWNALYVSDTYLPKTDLGQGACVSDLRDYPQLSTYQQNNFCSTFVDTSWNRGYVVHVPKNVVLEQPIDLHDIVPTYDADFLIEKVLIIVESGAQVQIKDVLRSTKTNIKTVVRSINIMVHDNAQVTFVYDQDWDKHVHDISTLQCILGRSSQFDYKSFISGGIFTKQLLNIDLNGQGARAYMRGAYLLNEQQQFGINVTQNHNAPHTSSDLIFKGVLNDHAQSVYQGTIFIEKNAHNSDATQNNKNILLNGSARAYSIPNLEVLNNDVQCAHGSAVGQLDAEQVLYAQSRGLSLERAQEVLLAGFLQNLFPDNSFFISDRLKALKNNGFRS